MLSRRRLEQAGLAAVVLLFLTISSRDASAPLNWNGAVMSAAARNHLTLGLGRTRLGAATNNAPDPVALDFYTHHPPGLPLLLSVSFGIFGVREWSARLVPIGLAAGSIVLLYLLARAGRVPLPLLPAAAFGLAPMALYYGREVCHEAPTAFLLLLAVLGYVRWETSGSRRALLGTAAALGAGMLMDWPAYLLAGALPLAHAVARRRGEWRAQVLLLPGLALLAFAGHLGHVSLLSGDRGLRDLVDIFLHRAGSTTSDRPGEAERFSGAAFVLVQGARATQLFTPVVLGAGLAGIAGMLRRKGSRVAALEAGVLALLLVGLLHVLLFRQGAWVHSYWLYYLGPPLALASAGVLAGLSRRAPAVAGALGIVAAASSGLVAVHLFRTESPPVRPLAALVRERVAAEATILTNHGSLSAPVGFYARRDASLDAVASVERLETSVAAAAGRPLAVLLDEGHPGADRIEPWLDARARGERWSDGRRRYRLYLLPRSTSAGVL